MINSVIKPKKYFGAVLKVLAFLISAVIILAGCGKSDTLTLSGSIESTEINATSEVTGKIIKVEKEESSPVKAGDVIAVVDSSTQQLVVKQQEALYKAKQSQLDLLKKGVFTQSIQAAEAELEHSKAALDIAKLQLSRYNIKSPADGTFLQKNINIGDIINTGTSIGTISDLKDLWVKFYIPQRHINLIELNEEIDLKSAALPEKTIKGRIIYISNQAEFTPKNTETNEAKENTVFKVKVKVLNNLDALKPGMTVETAIPTGGK
ncbi:MAG: efflux RND transporter periplasmic adaptor subunit [Clostridia bacterium]|nr:efflux RND transporter periplasmic adaptor subunit [Clostridia bacterium]